MLDVHPPQEKIHGIRDFLLHMLTITLGLLIALGLEGCVEWNHHRDLRNEADANLRQEIEDNQKDLAQVRASSDEEQKNLKGIAAAMQLRVEGKPIDKNSLRFGMKIATLRDASWETASRTGALGYMEYAQVKRYAAVYQLQRQFVEIQNLRLEKAPEMLAYVALADPPKLSTSDASAALSEVYRAMSRLESMREIGDALDQVYSQTLKAE